MYQSKLSLTKLSLTKLSLTKLRFIVSSSILCSLVGMGFSLHQDAWASGKKVKSSRVSESQKVDQETNQEGYQISNQNVNQAASQAISKADKNEALTVVLLTSLEMGEAPYPWLVKKYSNFEASLEKLFRSQMAKIKSLPFSLEVSHKADVTKLDETLKRKDVRAVFWLSHGGFIPEGSENSLFDFSSVYDYRGFDISSRISSRGLSSNLEFLGLVGCYSNPIVEDILKNNPNTKAQFFGSDAKTAAQVGLKDALEKFRKSIDYGKVFFHADRTEEPVETASFKMHIDRKMEYPTHRDDVDEKAIFYPALTVEYAGNVLAVLPRSKYGETQSIDIDLPKEFCVKEKTCLVKVSSGKPAKSTPNKDYYLGEMKMSLQADNMDSIEFESDVKRFEMSGKPIGTFDHIFKVLKKKK